MRKRGRAEVVEKIKFWFFENFEDPAHETPYISAEGGYLYIHGGPYDAREILDENFADLVPQATIDLAVAAIEEAGGPDWAPAGRRILPPDDDPLDEPPASTPVLHRRMLKKLDEVEIAFGDVWNSAPGIGHNNPPERVEPPVLDSAELTELRRAIALLKSQPPQPNDLTDAVVAAVSTLGKYGKKIAVYCGTLGDASLMEAAKAAGKETGKWVAMGGYLLAAAAAAAEWLHSVQLPF